MANNQDKANTAKEERYNGWTNYETWAVSLWTDDDPERYRYWRGEAACQVRMAAHTVMVRAGFWSVRQAAAHNLIKCLKDEFMDAVHFEDPPSCLEPSCYFDLFLADFAAVNWSEITDNLLADLDN